MLPTNLFFRAKLRLRHGSCGLSLIARTVDGSGNACERRRLLFRQQLMNRPTKTKAKLRLPSSHPSSSPGPSCSAGRVTCLFLLSDRKSDIFPFCPKCLKCPKVMFLTFTPFRPPKVPMSTPGQTEDHRPPSFKGRLVPVATSTRATSSVLSRYSEIGRHCNVSRGCVEERIDGVSPLAPVWTAWPDGIRRQPARGQRGISTQCHKAFEQCFLALWAYSQVFLVL